MEIQTIHLYREKEMDTDMSPKSDEQVFRATDYFDCLIAKKRTLTDTFCSIMNLEQDDIVKDDTSMQSYTLYFDEKMEEEYGEDMKISPFEPNEQKICGMPFLSIIQIHITTESLRRIKMDDSVNIIEQYQKDIADIVKKFKNNKNKEIFIYRVYKLLSAGDFAVVVRSKFPETSFKISTLIRCRMAGIESADGKLSTSGWALYKTYTLLTFDEKQILNNEMTNSLGKFVIRGCYSCQYWANEEIKTTYETYNFDNLNGRYDFSVEISENEFYQIYEYIKRYKSDQEISKDVLNGKSNVQKALLQLSQKKYLSYINIRYLIPKIEKYYRLITASEKIIVDENRNMKNNLSELKAENREHIDKLQTKYVELWENYTEILKFQQNAEQYFKMLGKNIRSCYSLNNQPDTRIYVVGICEQLDIILNGMSVYLELYKSADLVSKMDIARLVVSYIRIAVHTVDNYLEYVRNNNLQSLQTPNYNLESNMGMEKILIAYSEYLMNITQIMSVGLKQKGDTAREFYPIVVPDLNQSDICVEALFIEGYGIDNDYERQIREKLNGNRYVMVIGSPTLSELGDIPVFTAMLFHELAHQYRYETREKRNKIIKDLVLQEYANLITDNIINLAEYQTGVLDEDGRLFLIVNRAVYKGLHQNIYTDSDITEKEWYTPLVYFKEQLKAYIEEFNFYMKNKLDIESRTVKFVDDLFGMADMTGEHKQYLFYLYDRLNDKAKEWSQVSYLEELEKASFVVSAFCTVKECGIDASNEQVQEILDLENGSVVCSKNGDILFEDLWKILRQNITEHEDVLEQIKKVWQSYVYIIEEWCYSANDFSPKIKKEKVQDFENYVYKILSESWKEENKKFSENKIDGYRDWTLLGRWLQIDNNQKKEVFWNNIGYSFKNIQLKSIDSVISKYREITSDIAMYVMMNLEPFEYIKLMTTILPEDDLLTIFSADRIITVITVMQNKNLGVEQMIGAFLQEEIILVKRLQKFCENLKEKEQIVKFLEYVADQLQDGKNNDTCVDILPMIAELEKLKDKITSEDKEVFSYIIKMVKVIDKLLLRNKYYITLLFENKDLLDDYRNGVETMRNIMEQIDKNKASSMIKIKNMCNRSKIYIGKKHYKTGIVNDGQFNKESIDFLLDLYYQRKIRNARETRGLRNEYSNKDS